MSPGVWFIIATVVVAIALFVVGGIRVAKASLGLSRRVSSMTLPDIDLDRASAAIARIQADIERATELFARAQRALQSIDEEVRAMIRAFSRA